MTELGYSVAWYYVGQTGHEPYKRNIPETELLGTVR